jgi:hypothetical protein
MGTVTPSTPAVPERASLTLLAEVALGQLGYGCSATKQLEWISRQQNPHVMLGAEAAPKKPSKRNK